MEQIRIVREQLERALLRAGIGHILVGAPFWSLRDGPMAGRRGTTGWACDERNAGAGKSLSGLTGRIEDSLDLRAATRIRPL